jgi:hypothetical protein
VLENKNYFLKTVLMVGIIIERIYFTYVRFK